MGTASRLLRREQMPPLQPVSSPLIDLHRYRRDVAEISPRCSRDIAEMLPRARLLAGVCARAACGDGLWHTHALLESQRVSRSATASGDQPGPRPSP